MKLSKLDTVALVNTNFQKAFAFNLWCFFLLDKNIFSTPGKIVHFSQFSEMMRFYGHTQQIHAITKTHVMVLLWEIISLCSKQLLQRHCLTSVTEAAAAVSAMIL